MHIAHFKSYIMLPLLLCSAYLLGAPTVTNVSPVSGSVAGGNLVTITGSGFTGATLVNFGNKPAAIFNVINDTTIQAIAPVNSIGANQIVVTAPSGISALNPPFDYYTYQGNWEAYIPDFGGNDVTPIDVMTQIAGTPIPVGAGPNDIVFTPDGKTAITINSNANSITFIDVATQTPTMTIPVGVAYPILAISSSGNMLAIVGYSSNSVTFVDMTTLAMTIVPVGTQPSSIAMVPNGNLAYVTNSGSSSLTQINLQTMSTITIPAPVGSIPSFMGITPNGMTAVVTDDATDSVYIFDLMTLTFGLQIFGFSLHGANLLPEIAITPDGTTAWITNTSSNTISSVVGLNTATPSFGSSITVGTSPDGIAITPDGSQAYVSNAVTNNVSIVTFATASSIFKTVGTLPTDPGITPDQAPVAYFNIMAGVSGQSTQFDASESLSPVGTIVSYAWNFGDGSPVVVTTSPTISHTYVLSGLYNATLTVTNSAGTSTTQNYTGQVTLNNGGPSAMLTQLVAIEPAPAPAFEGIRCKNQFASQSVYVNILTWAPSNDPLVVSYLLFRDGNLIAVIPASGPLVYIDGCRCKNAIDVYTLIAVNIFNMQSPPLTITVR